jgi:class 3 adenylate cyclase
VDELEADEPSMGVDRGDLLLLTAAVAIPSAGLALLVAAPRLDRVWEQHPSHFWLVLWAAAINAVLAYATGVTAVRRHDARLVLVSIAFLAAGGFLVLHALATPGVLLSRPNAGFVVATPVGLLIAAVLFALSSLELQGATAGRVVKRSTLLRNAVLLLMLVWLIASLAQIPPLDEGDIPERASGPLLALAGLGIALYAFTVVRYLLLYRRRRDALVLALIVAAVLLAEALVAIALSRNWHASWWEWHVLMLSAFALVAWRAHRQWHEEAFSGLYLDETAHASREVSVLFADIAGFTAFSERHDPAEVSAMLNAYLAAAVPEVVRANGGTVDRILGDGLMAVFEARDGAEDHPVRAARAALRIVVSTDALAAAHEGWPRLRVGLNTGEGLVGVLGTSGARTYTVVGDVVNVASRLQGQAPVGGVTIGAETMRRLPGARFEVLGSLAVKGREVPVEAYRLLALEVARA